MACCPRAFAVISQFTIDSFCISWCCFTFSCTGLSFIDQCVCIPKVVTVEDSQEIKSMLSAIASHFRTIEYLISCK